MLYQLYSPSDAYYIEHLIKKADKLDIDWDDVKYDIKQIGSIDSFLDNPSSIIVAIMMTLKNMLVEEIKDKLNISEELEDEIIEELDRNTRINSYDSCLNTTEAFENLKDKLFREVEQIFDKYYIKENLSKKDFEEYSQEIPVNH